MSRAPLSGWLPSTAGLKMDNFSTSMASLMMGIIAERCRGRLTLLTVY